ncbi:hypothetical protein [Spongiimicrobium salis]|uniref:hypothetical protein n=1 Tax=Spongiimicrobium salis TaxID=1667022 RepID=UPI00374CE0B1
MKTLEALKKFEIKGKRQKQIIIGGCESTCIGTCNHFEKVEAEFRKCSVQCIKLCGGNSVHGGFLQDQ